jgi:hypothetical protein
MSAIFHLADVARYPIQFRKNNGARAVKVMPTPAAMMLATKTLTFGLF